RSRGGAHFRSLPGVLLAGDAEEPVADSRARPDSNTGVGKVGRDSNDRRLDSYLRWPLAGAAPLHTTGQGSGHADGETQTRIAISAPASHHLSNSAATPASCTCFVVKAFGHPLLIPHGFPFLCPINCESQVRIQARRWQVGDLPHRAAKPRDTNQ